MDSIRTWRVAQSPNYTANVDKRYPYSEVPYLGHKLVKIPSEHELIDLVDYWGEGRIQHADGGVSGFPDCYNINNEFWCVSNGLDKGKKIPNRVPVEANICDTSSYIKDNSVKIVTLLGAPIKSKCFADIARIVNKYRGKVVVFGLDDNSADINNLQTYLFTKGFIKCTGFELPAELQGLTHFDSISSPSILKLALRNHIINGEFDEAIEVSKAFAVSSFASTITEVVSAILTENGNNILTFAYKLWNGDAQRIVLKYLPVEFKLILNEEKVMILNKKFNQHLKLAVALDKDYDRRAWGAGGGKMRMTWKIMPVWKDHRLSFKLLNVDYGMFLKLAVKLYQDNGREAWGAYSAPDDRHYWDLSPVVLNGELLFFVVNRKYSQSLNLAENADSMGDRQLWSHTADTHYDTSNFGWYIKSLN